MRSSKLCLDFYLDSHNHQEQLLSIPNVLDGLIEEGPLPTQALSKPKTITKAQVQKCINQLSPHWDDEQLEVVVSMF